MKRWLLSGVIAILLAACTPTTRELDSSQTVAELKPNHVKVIEYKMDPWKFWLPGQLVLVYRPLKGDFTVVPLNQAGGDDTVLTSMFGGLSKNIQLTAPIVP